MLVHAQSTNHISLTNRHAHALGDFTLSTSRPNFGGRCGSRIVYVYACMCLLVNLSHSCFVSCIIFLWLDAALKQLLPSNSSCTIGSSKQNKHRPRIVAAASIHSAQIHALIIATDAHWAISRPVCVLRLISTADSRTERLCILLPASIRPSCITHSTLFSRHYYQPASQWNKHHPQIVAALKQTTKE